MKTLDQLIDQRRSVRAYKDIPVEREKLTMILEAARKAPSACNAQPWRIAAVTQSELRAEILKKGMGAVVPNRWAGTAAVIIVVCSERSLLTHHLAERVQGVQYHLIDIGIAMEHMALKAAELDLGTCYIGWFNEKPIKKILSLPSSWKVECLLTLGYPETIPDPTHRKSLDEITLVR